MDPSELEKRMTDAGAAVSSQSNESYRWVPAWLGIPLIAAVLIVFVCAFVWAVESDQMAPYLRAGVALASVALAGVIAFGVSYRVRQIRVRRYDQHMNQAPQGVVAAAQHRRLPVILRHPVYRDSYICVVSQPFVVVTSEGPRLVATEHIDVRARGVSWRDPVDVAVGDTIRVDAAAVERVRAPDWFRGDTGSQAYRDRTIVQLIGTEKAPVRIKVIELVGEAPGKDDGNAGDTASGSSNL